MKDLVAGGMGGGSTWHFAADIAHCFAVV